MHAEPLLSTHAHHLPHAGRPAGRAVEPEVEQRKQREHAADHHLGRRGLSEGQRVEPMFVERGAQSARRVERLLRRADQARQPIQEVLERALGPEPIGETDIEMVGEPFQVECRFHVPPERGERGGVDVAVHRDPPRAEVVEERVQGEGVVLAGLVETPSFVRLQDGLPGSIRRPVRRGLKVEELAKGVVVDGISLRLRGQIQEKAQRRPPGRL